MDRKKRVKDGGRPPTRLIRQLRLEHELSGLNPMAISCRSNANNQAVQRAAGRSNGRLKQQQKQQSDQSSTIANNVVRDNQNKVTISPQLASAKTSPVEVEESVQSESLLPGFALLRAAQLLNFDIYYLGLDHRSSEAARLSRLGDLEAASKVQQMTTNLSGESNVGANQPTKGATYCHTFLDELAEHNPLQKYIDRYRVLDMFCAFLKICLSLIAIMIGIDKAISNIILCLFTHIDESKAAANSSMSIFVLILHNLSFIYILFSTVFNGHLLWNLFSQRLFLVSRRFQCKNMLYLLVFVYLEYIINISFINNLYEWDFTSNNIQHRSYSVLANLRIFLTEQDEDHYYLDMLLTVLQFARGIIRISPYITINFTLICLKEHIHTIRNQWLLNDSLKRRQRLRLVVNSQSKARSGKRKRVIFATTETDGTPRPLDLDQAAPQPLRSIENHRAFYQPKGVDDEPADIRPLQRQRVRVVGQSARPKSGSSNQYLDMIENFDELESYITNLYIFTDRLNRFLSRQGLLVFFIVHNLVITVSLIVPEAVRGGYVMTYLIRFLLIAMAVVPFARGQSLCNQLEALSKQIDRIIIQQQFIHRRRDNLVRIRELIHDIRVNCGGMLTFNVETGIKYLVIAMATAFFIEQEHYKLTRRH